MAPTTREQLELADDRKRTYELRLKAQGKSPKLVKSGRKGVSDALVDWLLTREPGETVPDSEEAKEELMGRK